MEAYTQPSVPDDAGDGGGGFHSPFPIPSSPFLDPSQTPLSVGRAGPVSDAEIDALLRDSPGAAAVALDQPQPKTLKEYQALMEQLQKDNFGLKLRVFYLEERNNKMKPSNFDEIERENLELKVSLEEKIHELEQRNRLLVKARAALQKLQAQTQRRAAAALNSSLATEATHISGMTAAPSPIRHRELEEQQFRLMEQLRRQDEQLQSAQRDCEAARLQVAQQDQQIAERDAEISALKRKEDQTRAKLRQLEQQWTLVEEKSSTSKTAADHAARDLKTARMELAQFQQALRSEQAARASLTAEVTTLHSQLQISHDQCDQLQRQLGDTRRQAETYQKQQAILHNDLVMERARLQDASETRDSARQDLEAKIRQLERSSDSLRQQLAASDDHNSVQLARIKSLERQLADYTAAGASASHTAVARVAVLEKELAGERASLHLAERETAEARAELSTLRTALDGERQDRRALQGRLSSEQDAHAALQERLATLQSAQSSTQAQVPELQQAMAEQREAHARQISQWQARYTILQDAFTQLGHRVGVPPPTGGAAGSEAPEAYVALADAIVDAHGRVAAQVGDLRAQIQAVEGSRVDMDTQVVESCRELVQVLQRKSSGTGGQLEQTLLRKLDRLAENNRLLILELEDRRKADVQLRDKYVQLKEQNEALRHRARRHQQQQVLVDAGNARADKENSRKFGTDGPLPFGLADDKIKNMKALHTQTCASLEQIKNEVERTGKTLRILKNETSRLAVGATP